MPEFPAHVLQSSGAPNMKHANKESSNDKNNGDVSLNDLSESVIWLIKQEYFKKCIFIVGCAGLLTLVAMRTGTRYTPPEDVFVYCVVYCSWVTLCLPWLVQNLDGKVLGTIISVGFRLFAADAGVLAWSAIRGHRHLLQRGLRLKPLLEPSLSWLSEAGYNLRYGVVVAAVVASSVSIALDKYERRRKAAERGPGSNMTSNDSDPNNRPSRSHESESYPAAHWLNQRVKGQSSRQGRHFSSYREAGQGSVVSDGPIYFRDRRVCEESAATEGQHYDRMEVSQDLADNEDYVNEVNRKGQRGVSHLGDSLERLAIVGDENIKFLEEEKMPVNLVENMHDEPAQPLKAKPEKLKRRSPSIGDKMAHKMALAHSKLSKDPIGHPTVSKEANTAVNSKLEVNGNLRAGSRNREKSPQDALSDKPETGNKDTERIVESKGVVKREKMSSANRGNAKAKTDNKKAGSFIVVTNENRAAIPSDKTHSTKDPDDSTNRMNAVLMKKSTLEQDRRAREETKQNQGRKKLGHLNESMRNLITLKQKMLHFE